MESYSSHPDDVKNHMNHFLVNRAHEIANILAQSPNNFVPESSQGSIRSDADDEPSYIVEESDDVNVKQSIPHTSKPEGKVNTSKLEANGESSGDILRNKKEFRRTHHENSVYNRGSQKKWGWGGSGRSSEWRKDFERGKDIRNSHKNSEPQQQQRFQPSVNFSGSNNSRSQPNGTCVVTTDDQGNVSTSMKWSYSVRKVT